MQVVSRKTISAGFGVWLVSSMILCGQEPELATEQRLEHLVRAAALLENAGFAEQAAEIRQLVSAEDAGARQVLLDRKLAALAQLEADVAQLRQTVDEAPRVLVQLRLLKVHWSRLETMGLALAGIRHFDAPIPDDSGQLVAFLDALQKQGLIQTVAEPMLVATEGREAAFSSGAQQRRAGTAEGAAAASETHVRCRPERIGDGLRLHLELRHWTMVSPPPVREDEERQSGGEVGRALMQMSTVVEIAPGQTMLVSGASQQGEPDQDTELILVVTTQKMGRVPEVRHFQKDQQPCYDNGIRSDVLSPLGDP